MRQGYPYNVQLWYVYKMKSNSTWGTYIPGGTTIVAKGNVEKLGSSSNNQKNRDNDLISRIYPHFSVKEENQHKNKWTTS